MSCLGAAPVRRQKVVDSCSCTDCQLSCPVLPPIPAPDGAWMVGAVYGTTIVMVAVFAVVALLLIVAINVHRKGRRSVKGRAGKWGVFSVVLPFCHITAILKGFQGRGS